MAMLPDTEVFVVTCEGCGLHYLAGTCKNDDPAYDVTYREDTQTIVCNECYGALGKKAHVRVR